MKKLILLTAMFSALFVGCSDDEEVGTFGPNQTITGFAESTMSKSFFTNQSSAVLNVPISLIAYQNEVYPANVTVQYTVDPSSTATAGVEYTANTTNTASIASGNTVGFISFNVNPSTFDAFNPKTLVLNLTNVTTGNAVVGQQFKQIVVTLQGVCVSEIGGNYTNSTVRPATGTVTTFSVDTFTPTGVASQYSTKYIGPYYCPGQAPGSATSIQLPAGTNAGYIFTDICDQIKLETQNLAAAFTNLVRQSPLQYSNSSRNPSTGVVVVHYSIFFTNDTVERPFVSTYTPIP
jgi:hypothetical protein